MNTQPQRPSALTLVLTAAALGFAAIAVVVLEAATRRWPVPGGAE